jgi:DnaK suppressor protein
MPSTFPLSQDHRAELAELLKSRLLELGRDRASELHGLTQAESAREIRLHDDDEARQRAGEIEVDDVLSDIESSEYNEIRNALQRIHGAEYGLCIDCHDAIPLGRLRIEPQALRCVACQARYEQHR